MASALAAGCCGPKASGTRCSRSRSITPRAMASLNRKHLRPCGRHGCHRVRLRARRPWRAGGRRRVHRAGVARAQAQRARPCRCARSSRGSSCTERSTCSATTIPRAAGARARHVAPPGASSSRGSAGARDRPRSRSSSRWPRRSVAACLRGGRRGAARFRQHLAAAGAPARQHAPARRRARPHASRALDRAHRARTRSPASRRCDRARDRAGVSGAHAIAGAVARARDRLRLRGRPARPG